ncbi:MAG: inorganic phosphate transporter [Planctomycetota bacterium]|nr:inorganic phosphate transporter [Planctomycetota bacterium]
MIFVVILAAGLCVAYANGANDNFKGVATLFGSGTTSFRRALAWATITTFLGSLAAFLLAGNLIKSFSGKGLVDDAIATQPAFAAAVALGAGLTVLLATRIGMPISTTHSLVGALIGTGLIAGSALNLSNLGSRFLLPLLVSPILAVIVTGMIYPVLRFARLRLGITRDVCLCVGNKTVEVLPAANHAVAIQRAEQLTATLGDTVTCQSRYQGQILGISAAETLDRFHFLSAGMVSFARGLNDTPKFAAMLLVAPYLGVSASLVLVGIVIAVGGLLSARRVAETMSRRITTMNHGQGFTANLVTGLIVIAASRFGLPVSTTHVSCGSLFGVGAVTGQADKKTIATILLAWFVTLPVAAVLAGVSFWILKQI